MEKSTLEKFNKIKEEDVGITQFMDNTNTGFKCILKHRYSDFIVNEIDINGKVIWIKDTQSIQENELNKIITEEKKEEITEEKTDKIIKEKFTELTESNKEKLYDFISNFINKQNTKDDFLILPYLENKEDRKKFHEKIRENFPFLDSETFEEKNTKKKSIKITYITKQSYFKRRKIFPDKTKNILYFALLKRNMDTVTAINYLSRMLHRKSKIIKFAGNKDKRGITTQLISCYNTLPNEITGLINSKNFNKKNIECGNFSFHNKELRLGLLKGNQFCVLLRFINDKDFDIKFPNIIKNLNNNGFINYFGMQRFGVNNIPTHYIGKLIIKKKWKDAFLNILNSNIVFDGMKQLNLSNDLEKEIFSLNDKDSQMKIISDLMKIIPKFTTEYKLLFNYYKSGKNSFQNSIKNLNKQLQVLFPHSYQSYIWNLSVSYRIEKFGKKLIIGDIVKKHDSLYEEKNQEEDFNYDDEEDNENINIENKNIENNNIENNNIENNNNENNNKEKLDKIFLNNFDYITEENINKYSFFDLVLPIVGYEIYYPKNEMKNYIEELLKKDDLTINDFKYQNLNFYTTGYFRKVIEKPLNEIKYEIIHHDNPDEDLQTPYYNIENHPNPKGNKYKSVRIIFQLPQSTYATMLFREITKISSSGNFQAHLAEEIKGNNDN